MKTLKHVLIGALMLCGFCLSGVVSAEQAPNPRTIANSGVRTHTNSGSVSRVATNGRTGATAHSDNTSYLIGRVARSAARNINNSFNANVVTPIVRTARGASSDYISRDMSRAATIGRATAVFSDVTKIGSGYANCRDAYATCMDQFCANANDTYRRCFCSDRFSDFRDTENKLDKAITLLAEFEDNNLNAVDKTAAEVKAMYSASEGERAIKKDTTAAAKMLNEIDNLLSGKSVTASKSVSYKNIGLIDVNFSADLDDVWSGAADSAVFGFGSGTDLSTLEGVSLYNAVNSQCMKVMADSCENSAVANMAKSSYSVLISQDCNAYAKKVNAKTEQVKQTVRTAEKYLREARLEEYRAHNSSDMNACITAVKSAILADSACGTDYKHCLDNTGVFINNSTGEPIYSMRLFKLTDLIQLSEDVSSDLVAANPEFSKFLDTKRKYAENALDSCRDIANDVWKEFKRSALVEIAQLQDEKIEEVKTSCVETMGECYDTQSGALKGFDTTTAGVAEGVSVVAARNMCADKVTACALLYNDSGCQFGADGKLASGTKYCGLQSLLDFVAAVDTNRVSEACDTLVADYLTDFCQSGGNTYGYPYSCRLRSPDDVKSQIQTYVQTNCYDANGAKLGGYDNIVPVMNNLRDDMSVVLSSICSELGGYWMVKYENTSEQDIKKLHDTDSESPMFYNKVFGGEINNDWGTCFVSQAKKDCDAENDKFDDGLNYYKYDAKTDTCNKTALYYEYQDCVADSDKKWVAGVCSKK